MWVPVQDSQASVSSKEQLVIEVQLEEEEGKYLPPHDVQEGPPLPSQSPEPLVVSPPQSEETSSTRSFEFCMSTMHSMGIGYETAEVALLCTEAKSVEAAIDFIYSHPEEIFHKFQGEANLCKRCDRDKTEHLIDEHGRLTEDDEMLKLMKLEALIPFVSNHAGGDIPVIRQSYSLSDDSQEIRIAKKRSGSIDDGLTPEERQRKARELAEKARENALRIVAAQQKGEQHEEVKEGMEMCGICMEAIEEKNAFKAPCKHNYCQTCLTEHFRLKILDANVLHLTCVEPSCSRKITDQEIRSFLQYLHPDMSSKYEKFRKNAILAENPNTRWCPSPGCETALTNGSVLNPRLTCPKCQVQICFNCSERWHGRKKCSEVADQMYGDWAKGKDVQNCPRCRARIWKNEGCNHMTCFNCKYEFCWLCRSKYSQYHFKEWNVFGCPGSQFILEDESSWRPPHYCIPLFRLFYVIGILILIALALGAFGVALGLGLVALPFVGAFYLFIAIRDKLQDRRWRRSRQRRISSRPAPTLDQSKIIGLDDAQPPARPPPPVEDDFEEQVRRAMEESLKPQYNPSVNV